MLFRLAFVVGTIAGWLAITPERGYACLYEDVPASEVLADADSVFLGTVVSIRVIEGNLAEVEFETERIWRGAVSPIITLKWTGWNVQCAITLDVGEKWVVFSQDGVIDDRFGATWPARRSAGLMAFLDQGNQVGEGPGYPNGGGGGLAAESRSDNGVLEALVASGLVLVMTIAASRAARRSEGHVPRR